MYQLALTLIKYWLVWLTGTNANTDKVPASTNQVLTCLTSLDISTYKLFVEPLLQIISKITLKDKKIFFLLGGQWTLY